MKVFLFFISIISLMVLPLIHIAYADNKKCEEGFFYADGECFKKSITSAQKDALQSHINLFQKSAIDALVIVSDIANNIEDKKRQDENANIDLVANVIIKYIDSALAFEKNIGHDIKKDKIRKEKHRRYDKHGVLGVSIYRATFELYEIFDEADIFDLSKRQITDKHNKVLDALNLELTKSVDNYATAYLNDINNEIEVSKATVLISIKKSVKALADIYADEIKNITPENISAVKKGRKEVIDDAVENVYEDHERFQRKMNRKHD